MKKNSRKNKSRRDDIIITKLYNYEIEPRSGDTSISVSPLRGLGANSNPFPIILSPLRGLGANSNPFPIILSPLRGLTI